MIWPEEDYDILERQLRDGLHDQYDGTPVVNLFPLLEKAISDLFVGVRVVKPGRRAAVKEQRAKLRVQVVDMKGGKVVARRSLKAEPITVSWPD